MCPIPVFRLPAPSCADDTWRTHCKAPGRDTRHKNTETQLWNTWHTWRTQHDDDDWDESNNDDDDDDDDDWVRWCKLFRPLLVQMMMRWCFQTPWKLQITSRDFFLFLPERSRTQTCITYASQPTSQSSLDYLALIRRKEVDNIYSWSPDTQRTTLIFLTNGRCFFFDIVALFWVQCPYLVFSSELDRQVAHSLNSKNVQMRFQQATSL